MDATTIVLLLITLVAACVAAAWAHRAERRIDEMRDFLDYRIGWFEDIRARSIETRAEVGRHEGRIKGLKTSIAITDQHVLKLEEGHIALEERTEAVEKQVAGMLVSREVLTLPEPTFTATAYVDGGHAATDEQARDPRWNHGDADPETAEAQPQPDDDQATAVNDVQAVEERFESLGYVAKESA